MAETKTPRVADLQVRLKADDSEPLDAYFAMIVLAEQLETELASAREALRGAPPKLGPAERREAEAIVERLVDDEDAQRELAYRIVAARAFLTDTEAKNG